MNLEFSIQDSKFKIQDSKKMKIVIIGHVDHGKSTLVGQLLIGTGSIETNKLEAVQKICAEQGKKFEPSFLLDALEEERSQGITIDLVRVPFHTDKREYEIIDAPGHKEFLKNMISGAAGADAAIVMISADEGISEQSIRHGNIISVLGISQVIVVVNKMDLVDYNENRFKEITAKYTKYLKKINVHPLKFIPVSAFAGENIFAKSNKMPWFTGDFITNTIDEFKAPKNLSKNIFRLAVQDVYKFDERRIIAGKTISGTLKIGEKVIFWPSQKTSIVKSFESWNSEPIKKISAGDSVGITLNDQIFIERGEICTRHTEPIKRANKVRANIVWMGNDNFEGGKEYKFKLATQEITCSLIKIETLVDPSSLSLVVKEAHIVEQNEIAQVIIALKKPLCFDIFQDISETGRFVILDGYQVAGGGVIHKSQVGIS